MPSEPAATLETTDAARLRLAASFLSSISLRPAPRRRASSAAGGTGGRAHVAACAGGNFTPSGTRSSAEFDRRGTDASAGASWQAAAALNFLSNLQLMGAGASLSSRGKGTPLGGSGKNSSDQHLAKELSVEGAPATPDDRLSERRVADMRVLAFAQLRELYDAGSVALGGLNSTRVLFRASAMGPPCLALSVLPFERGDEVSLLKGGTRTKPFVSQLVTQQAARARLQRQQLEQEQEQQQQQQQEEAAPEQQSPSAQQTQTPTSQSKGTPDGAPQPPVKYKGVAYGVILHGDRDDSEPYDPFHLDDPELQSGKHRRVMRLPGFVESVIPFVRPQELKAQLNEQFALKHQWLSYGLTLSKIRAIKRELLAFAQEVDCDLSTVAVAYVYFEKLVLRNVVNKPNRKLMAAVSLVLAAKWNEHHKMKGLLQQVERHYAIPRAVLFRSEFSVYVELAFKLQIEPQEVYPHFLRLLQTLERTPREYLGEVTFQEYLNNFIKPKRLLTEDDEQEASPETGLR